MSERLYRSREDRMIAGVAGGIADRLDVDPALIRIVWALLVIPTGFIALVAYVIAAIVIPDEDDVRPRSGAWPVPGGQPPPSVTPTQGPPRTQGPPPQLSNPQPPAQPMTAQPMTAQPMTAQPRMTRRERRRAARAARGHDVGSGTATWLVGGGLILLGLWLLVRDYVPEIDASRFWPIAAVGLGIALVVIALSRRSDHSDGGR